MRMTMVSDKDLFGSVDTMVSTNTDTRQIRTYLSNELGITISGQDVRNLKAKRGGNDTVAASCTDLLSKFVADKEKKNCALVIKREDGELEGIVMQSEAQRMMFEMWGEALTLDWTHGTNAHNFYLGMCNRSATNFI